MGKVKNMLKAIPKWNTAPQGKSLNLKEWFAYCFGGAGAMGASVFIQFITMSAGIYIAAALNINVDHIVYIGLATSVITILSSPLASWLIDNTNSKYGKFRPYLIWLPIPMIVLYFLLGQLLVIKNYTIMLVAYIIIFNILNFLNRMYTISFTSIVQVISPNVDERVSLMSFGTFVTSLGPTIVTMVYPAVANFIYSQGKVSGVNTLSAVKWLVPIFATVFFALGLWMAFGVKERVVISKKFKQKQKFKDGAIKTVKNKYFWIGNISGVLGTFKIIATTFTTWIILYMIFPKLVASGHGDAGNMMQTIIVTLVGDACVPGMLIAPWLIKKFGKKKIIITTNILTVISTIPMIFLKNEWALLVMIYLVTFFNGFQIVTAPAVQAEIYDYQQFKTGDRLEGFISQFGTMLTTPFAMALSFIAPAVYKKFGYIDDVSVLYENEVLIGIISTMCIIGVISGLLSTIPYLFYDLSANKHKQIMEVLKVRANAEDGLCDEAVRLELEQRILNGEQNVLAFFDKEQQSEGVKMLDEDIQTQGEGETICIQSDIACQGQQEENLKQISQQGLPQKEIKETQKNSQE